MSWIAVGVAAAAAIGGGVMGGQGAGARNRAARHSANLNFDRLNDYITQNRTDRILQTENLSRNAQVTAGAALNVSPDNQSAIETIASRIGRGVASDQFSIDEEARRREVAANADKLNVQAQSQSQMQNPTLSALSGILGGASAGLSLGGGINTAVNASQAAPLQQGALNNQLTQSQIATEAAQINRDTATMQRDYWSGISQQAWEQTNGINSSMEYLYNHVFSNIGGTPNYGGSRT